jgi:hypothetical protein
VMERDGDASASMRARLALWRGVLKSVDLIFVVIASQRVARMRAR